MKRTISILLILIFCFALSSDAKMLGMMAKKKSIAGCSTPGEYCTGTDDISTNLGSTSANVYVSSMFLATSTSPICRVDVVLSEEGTYAGNVTLYIYSDDGAGDEPESLLGSGSTNTVGAAQIPGTAGKVSFTGISSGNLVIGTKYHIVLKSSTADGTNHIHVWMESADCLADGEEVNISNDASTWTSASTTQGVEFEAYK